MIGDFDPTAGTLAINKARVAGMDKDSTKAAEDRSIVLCPRAMNVLRRQLVLRSRLERTGRIDHDHLFFKASGALIRNLQYPYVRWRRTLDRLGTIRYRRPYCARHASVSWDLMIGRDPLWVAKQHGHSITTMLRVYTAWAEGAIEADLSHRARDAVRREHRGDVARRCRGRRKRHHRIGQRQVQARRGSGPEKELSGGERGIRTGLRPVVESVTY